MYMAHSMRFFWILQLNSYGVWMLPPYLMLLAWQPPLQKNLAQQSQQMGFNTQSQRQQWQQSAPGGQQPSYSQGDPDDFSVIDDSDDLPF